MPGVQSLQTSRAGRRVPLGRRLRLCVRQWTAQDPRSRDAFVANRIESADHHFSRAGRCGRRNSAGRQKIRLQPGPTQPSRTEVPCGGDVERRHPGRGERLRLERPCSQARAVLHQPHVAVEFRRNRVAPQRHFGRTMSESGVNPAPYARVGVVQPGLDSNRVRMLSLAPRLQRRFEIAGTDTQNLHRSRVGDVGGSRSDDVESVSRVDDAGFRGRPRAHRILPIRRIGMPSRHGEFLPDKTEPS